MITVNGLGEPVVSSGDRRTAPLPITVGMLGGGAGGAADRYDGILRHRRHRPSNLGEALASLSAFSAQENGIRTRTLESVPSRTSLASSNSSSSSEEDFLLDDDRYLTDSTRTLFGFPYPLLVCLMISFVLLPLQVMCYNASTEEGDKVYLSLQQEKFQPIIQPQSQQKQLHAPFGHQHHGGTDEQGANIDEPPKNNIDAIAFIALGPAATQPVLGWSVHSAVQIGGWHGNVYVITDEPEAVSRTLVPPDVTPSPDALKPENLHIIHLKPEDLDMPSSLHSFNAKLTKCRILRVLPEELENIVYIDSDIITGRPLASFWKSLAQVWKEHEDEDDLSIMDDDLSLHDYRIQAQQASAELGLFEDGKAFTVGFCKDCDTWNTGVISLKRGRSDSCLDAWCARLAIEGGTDQAALDKVIAETGHCQNIQAIDRKEMRMMKDIFVVLGFVGTKTFNHFTGVFRPQNLNAMHRRFYERMLGKKLSANQPFGVSRTTTTTSRRLRDVPSEHNTAKFSK